MNKFEEMKADKKLRLSIEFVLLFFCVPLFLFFEENILHPSSLLLPILIALILYFRKQKDFKTGDLFRLNVSKKKMDINYSQWIEF